VEEGLNVTTTQADQNQSVTFNGNFLRRTTSTAEFGNIGFEIASASNSLFVPTTKTDPNFKRTASHDALCVF